MIFNGAVRFLIPLLFLLCLTMPGGAAEEAVPHTGGTLVFGTGNDAVSLDPPNQWDGASSRVIQNVYETLVTHDPVTLEIVPLLATTWEISLNRRVWTFTIRSGVKFHDGTPLTAEDVKFNFDRQMVENHPFSLGKCECFHSNFRMLDTVEVEGDKVRFHLSRPYVPFVDLLAMSPLSIASPRAIKGDREEFWRHPCGTGPFVFSEWVAGEKIVLRTNTNYWQQRPYLDSIVFRVIPNNRLRRVKLSSGSLDAMDGVNPDELEIIKRNPRLRLLTCPGLNVGYIAMNTLKPPFDKVDVRRAVNLAINREAILRYLYQGIGVPALSPLPPNMWGYNSNLEEIEFNPEKARELLSAAGFPEGFETSLYVLPITADPFPTPDPVADAVIKHLADVGIKVKKLSYDWRTYQEKVLSGEHEMAMLTWTADIPDPDNFLHVLFSSENTQPGMAENIAFYRNAELDGLLRDAQESLDHGKRIQLYQQAQAVIHRDAPWILIAHASVILALRDDVRGMTLTPLLYDNYRRVWLER